MGDRSARISLLTAAVLALAPGIAVAQTHAEQVKAAFDEGSLYVAPTLRSEVSAADAKSLEARIDREAGNRIHIALIPPEWAPDKTAVAAFAHQVAGDRRGATVVVAGTPAHVVTSYENSAAAVSAIDAGFKSSNDPVAQLEKVIDNLADADPGRSGDLDNGQHSTSPTFDIPDANKIVGDVTGTIKFVFILIAALFVLPIAFFVIRGIIRGGREHHVDKERLQEAIKAADDERTKLGDDIVDLDAATSMPNVPEQARKDYEQAMDAYDASETKLKQVDTPGKLAAVQKLIADGRSAAARAREATGAGQ